MSKYALVDKDTCISCGACGVTAPDIFGCDDNGFTEVVYQGDKNRGTMEIPESLYRDLQDAIEGCPTGAVQVAETPFSA
ncbi:ferredoxin [Nocardia sp. CA-128927]|uniref:ferredoxin n=1 Tax=Nocardia sp. CA-128927 TaxID=3239975 RepID=UPI003D9957CD